MCILLFKDGLSNNAIKRLKTLKKSDDGFIAEEDLKIRGFGDLTGFQQSGLNFRFADPLIHKDLFKLAEEFLKKQYSIKHRKI